MALASLFGIVEGRPDELRGNLCPRRTLQVVPNSRLTADLRAWSFGGDARETCYRIQRGPSAQKKTPTPSTMHTALADPTMVHSNARQGSVRGVEEWNRMPQPAK